MIKKILKTVRGFSPVELVIMVGFGALAAAALIFLATSPQYMASTQPTDVNVNIKVGESDSGTCTTCRQPSAKAQEACDPLYVTPNSMGGFDVTPASDVDKDPVNVQCAVDNADVGGTVNLLAGAFFFADAVEDSNAPSGYKINYTPLDDPATEEIDGVPLIPSQFWFINQFFPYLLGANHGNDQRVSVTHSVKIIGEKDSNGNHLTKIVGGYWPISVGRLPSYGMYFNFFDDVLTADPDLHVDTTTQSLDVTVKDIEFADSYSTAIVISPATGATIDGNKFTDMRGMDLIDVLTFAYETEFTHHPYAYGIVLSSPGSTIHLTTGNYSITNNIFEGHDRPGDSNDPWVQSYPQYNTSFRGMTAAMRVMGISGNITISNNILKDVASIGFSSEDNLSLNGSGGNTLISGNTLDMGTRSAIVGPTQDLGFDKYDIWAMEYNWCDSDCRDIYEMYGMTVGKMNLAVKDNKIKVSAPMATSAVLLINTLDAAVTKNTIDFIGENWDRIGMILLGASGNLVGQNKMIGNASFGVIVAGDSDNNVFTGNNLDTLSSYLSYIIETDSNNNIVKGYTGGPSNVWVGGTDNLLTDVTEMTGSGIGQEVSDSVQKVKDLEKMERSWSKALKTLYTNHPEYKTEQ